MSVDRIIGISTLHFNITTPRWELPTIARSIVGAYRTPSTHLHINNIKVSITSTTFNNLRARRRHPNTTRCIPILGLTHRHHTAILMSSRILMGMWAEEGEVGAG